MVVPHLGIYPLRKLRSDIAKESLRVPRSPNVTMIHHKPQFIHIDLVYLKLLYSFHAHTCLERNSTPADKAHRLYLGRGPYGIAQSTRSISLQLLLFPSA